MMIVMGKVFLEVRIRSKIENMACFTDDGRNRMPIIKRP
jgi:hypothetical protein